MRNFQCPRLTYANVVATVALVFAMSGSAVAANTYLIKSTKQIHPKVLRALKGRTGPAGKPGLPGPAGAVGARGPAGPTGPAGPSQVPSGFAETFGGNGGTPLDATFQPVVALSRATSSSGPITVTAKSRLVATASATLLGASAGSFNVHVDCILAVTAAGSVLPFTNTPARGLAGNAHSASVTLVNSTDYRDLALTVAIDVNPGTYDVGLMCGNRSGGTGTGGFNRASLTITGAPL